MSLRLMTRKRGGLGGAESRSRPRTQPLPAASGPARRVLLGALVCLFAVPVTVAGQVPETAPAPPPADFLQPWRWVSFTTDSGLPSNRVHQVLETPSGEIWAATRRGVAWFDGYVWHSPSDEAGLPAGREASLAIGPDGALLAVVDGVLYRGGRDGFAAVPLQGSPRVHEVAALGEELLVRSGVSAYILEDVRLREVPGASWDADEPVSRLIADPPATVWLRTRRGIYRWRDGTWLAASGDAVFPPDSRDELITLAVHPGRQSALGLFQSGALRRLTVVGGRSSGWSDPLPVPQPLKAAHALAYRPNGDLWAATDTGLRLYLASSELWTQWFQEPAGRGNRVSEILATGSGEIWVGTGEGVELHAADGAVRRWGRIGDTELTDITGVSRDGAGAVWITSAYGFTGAFRWDGARWHAHRTLANGDDAPRIFRAVSAPDGTVLLPAGTGPGVWEASATGLEPWPPAAGIRDRDFYELAWTPDGRVWAATSAGVGLWDGTFWDWWGTDRGLRHPDVWMIAADAAGNAWFSDGLNGVATLDVGGEPRYFTSESGLASNAVLDVWTDDSGVWAATDGGASRYAEGTWVTLGSTSGLETLHLSAGASTGERILFGTAGAGVQILDVSEIATARLRIDLDEPATRGDAVVFSWDVHPYWGLTFPGGIETRYRIGDGDWSAWSERGIAHVDNLAPGPHPVTVEARAGLGGGAVARAMTEVTVAYPIWRRPAFWTPVTGLVAIIVALATVYLRRRLQHEREIATSRAWMSMMMEQMPASLWIADRDLVIRSVQGSLYRKLGFEDQDLVGANLRDFIAEAESATIHAHREALEGRSASCEGRWEERTLQIHVAPLTDRSGRVAGVVGLAVDITERARLEEELGDARRLEAIGRLAGGVAHDFNNLLVAINGYAEMVLAELDEDDPVRDDVAEIARAGDRAAALTSQLLAFGRRQVRAPRILDVDEVLDDAEKLLGRLIGENIRLERRRASSPCWVESDRSQLEQVIVNLALNARDAMPEGGTLEFGTERVTLSPAASSRLWGAPPGEYVVLRVSDTGIGIHEQDMEHIFEPFFTTKGTEGTGLGLATVYGIVKQNGGWIAVDSEPGRNTTFGIYLPAQEKPAPEAVDREGSAPAAGRGTVLVVEDDGPVRRVVERCLGGLGYRILAADGPDEAVRLLEQEHPDLELLVTDIVMPGMDGTELASRVRREMPDLPVLFISGYTDREIGALSEDGPPSAYLPKPFSHMQLAKNVEDLIGAGSGPTSRSPRHAGRVALG